MKKKGKNSANGVIGFEKTRVKMLNYAQTQILSQIAFIGKFLKSLKCCRHTLGLFKILLNFFKIFKMLQTSSYFQLRLKHVCSILKILIIFLKFLKCPCFLTRTPSWPGLGSAPGLSLAQAGSGKPPDSKTAGLHFLT